MRTVEKNKRRSVTYQTTVPEYVSNAIKKACKRHKMTVSTYILTCVLEELKNEENDINTGIDINQQSS